MFLSMVSKGRSIGLRNNCLTCKMLSMSEPIQTIMVSDAKPSALIFGAYGGIGSCLARRLAASGWRLALTGRKAERLEKIGAETNAFTQVAEATAPGEVEAVFNSACEKFERLDGVVNCCGSLLLKSAHLTTDVEWAHTLSANLTTAFLVLRMAAARMMRTGGGSIVLMSSAVALRGMINHEAIAAAKAGVVGLAQSAAATYVCYNIRVNCVAPGLTRTPLAEPITKMKPVLKPARLCILLAGLASQTKSPAPLPGCLIRNKNG
jgi:NAD(P)-dependent dehydrogenase (short-subunit alcohol dehydrogenase family)